MLPLAARADAFDNRWCEVTAPGFSLISDLEVDEARDMVRLMEAFRPVAERYLPGTPNAEDPALTVMLFARQRDFRRAIGRSGLLGYLQPGFDENLMVVGPYEGLRGDHESLLHEFVHYLLRTRTDINLPNWYDEGLAGMLSTARLRDGEVVLGGIDESRVEEAIRRSELSLEEVLGAADVWDWHTEGVRGFYDWSHLLVHRLALGHLEGRDDWRQALEDVLAERAESLPAALELSPAVIGRRLLRYLHSPPEIRHSVALPDAAAPQDEQALPARCLDERETVLRLSLAVVHQNPGEAVDRLREQLEQHSDDAELWRALSLAEESDGEREGALAAARLAVALAPEDNDAAVRLAGALAIGCILTVSEECFRRWQEGVPLLRRALRRDPTEQTAIFTLGLAYLYSGRGGEALNYLRIAHRRQPWAPHVNFYLGEAYRLIGDSRAEAHLQRARRWSTTELWRLAAEAGLEELDNP